jgi:hypothetical protein
MSKEQTLALPLSGEEVIAAVCAKIASVLRQDCFLSPMTAYESVTGSVSVILRMRDIGRFPEVQVVVPVSAGNIAPSEQNPDAALSEFEADIEIEEQSPNEARVDSGQDVPVLVEGEGGRKEIKGIKYAKKTEVKR